ncbi:MAG TPA: hypothetical protein VFN11_17775, partial [Ktedonobacterales bacterium]|nr:hypothetical protein [Ktedonobacterales bacterium]
MAYAQPLAQQAALGIGQSGIVDSRGNPMQTAQAETEQQRKTRKRIMEAAYKAYAGQMDEPLKVKPGDLNDNAIIGLMRPIVETGVSFLFGKAVTFEVETLNSSDKPAPMVMPGRRPAK